MLERVFQLSAHGTTVRIEVLAGLTTFAAMAYVMAVNPAILAACGMDRTALITATALASAFGSFAMALLANYPIALAPGMGINAFFALTVCQGMGIPWQAALGFVFWDGVLFLALSLSGFRERIVEAVPVELRIGIQGGIGMFIAFIGLKNAGMIVADPATLVTLGDLSQTHTFAALLGVILVGALLIRKVPGAFLVAILALSTAGLFIPGAHEAALTHLPARWIDWPAPLGPAFFGMDLGYPIHHWQQSWPIIFAFLFVDFFDTLGTLVGVGRGAGLFDEKGGLPRIKWALVSDSLASSVGAALGTSTVTSYIESAAGVKAGGKTGLTSAVVGLCFLASLIFAPVIRAIPSMATAPVLIVIGVLMLEGLKDLDLGAIDSALPSLMTVMVMPLAFSISEGIAVGFIVFTALKLATGKASTVSGLTYGLAALFLIRYWVL